MRVISKLINVSFVCGFKIFTYYDVLCIFYLDVKELVQECVGGAALQQCKSKIQSYGEQTASALKKHVYANYMQFIETAKEISRTYSLKLVIFKVKYKLYNIFWGFLDLESEMYQLSHLLIEQRNILSTLREQNTTESTKDVLLDEPENGELQFDFEK